MKRIPALDTSHLVVFWLVEHVYTPHSCCCKALTRHLDSHPIEQSVLIKEEEEPEPSEQKNPVVLAKACKAPSFPLFRLIDSTLVKS